MRSSSLVVVQRSLTRGFDFEDARVWRAQHATRDRRLRGARLDADFTFGDEYHASTKRLHVLVHVALRFVEEPLNATFNNVEARLLRHYGTVRVSVMETPMNPPLVSMGDTSAITPVFHPAPSTAPAESSISHTSCTVRKVDAVMASAVGAP